MQAYAYAAAGGIVQSQIEQGLARIVKGFATGHQAEAVVRAFDHIVVEPVGTHIGQRGIPLGVKQARFLIQCAIGPAYVHAACGHFKIGRHHNFDAVRVHIHRCAGFDDFLNRFHTGPDTGVAAHGKAVHAQIQNVLHAGRKKYRGAAGLKNMVALVRCRRAFGHMVITSHGNHAAPGRGACHIGVLEHIRAPVHARAFAVPDAKHAVVFIAARRRKA